jgi:hypothetical protein
MRVSPLLPLALWCLRRGALAEAQVAEDACEDAELTRADLLQVGLSRSTPAAAGPVASERAKSSAELAANRAESLKPAYWMHVPKTGSTFESVLLGNPTLCPGFMHHDRTGLLDPSISSDAYRGLMASPFYNSVVRTACPGAFHKGALGNHNGLASMADDERRGHGLVMLRQPEQRLISSYNDGQHDWALELAPAKNLVGYAHAVAGCTVKMLTRSGTDVCVNQTKPLDSEVTEAVLRIEEDFAFVGLTDEWRLSICLFHAMFGGVANEIELMAVGSTHTTVGVGRTVVDTSQYNTSVLEGFTDSFDGPVYEKATYRFQRDIQLYGLSEDSCASILGQ